MKKKGFTLIEMLVVITIIGIVLTLVIPNVARLMNKGSQQKFEKQEKLAVEAGKLYALSNQGDLKDVERISGLDGIEFSEQCWIVSYNTLIQEGLIEEENISCNNNKSYVRITKRNKSGYDIDSFLECEDKKGNKFKTEGKETTAHCLGYNGNYNENYTLYDDSEMTHEYNPGTEENKNWVLTVYAKFESEGPYGNKIYGYQWSKDGFILDINTISADNQGIATTSFTNYDGPITVRAIDTEGNIGGYKTFVIHTDSKVPEVTIGDNPKNIIIESYNYTDNLDVEYGLHGGNVTCNPEKSDGLDQQKVTVTCKAVGNNGLEKEVSFESNIDLKTPKITSKRNQILVTSTNYDFTNNITSEFGILGGSVTCNPSKATNQDQKTIEVTCIAKGNNNKTASTTFTVQVDAKTPVITAKSDPISLKAVDYDFADNITVSYGYLGGSFTCNPARSQMTGSYIVTCEAIGNNGLRSSVSFTARHSYPATETMNECQHKNCGTEKVTSSKTCTRCTNCTQKVNNCVDIPGTGSQICSEVCVACSKFETYSCGTETKTVNKKCKTPECGYSYSCPNGGTLSGTTCYY